MAVVRIQDFFKSEGQKQNFVFFFKAIRKPLGADDFQDGVVAVPIDSTISENHNLTAQITDNEVQKGSIVSDHIHIQPRRVSIKAVIQESPVFFLSSATRALVDLGTNLTFDVVSGATGLGNFARRISPVLSGFEKYAREFVSASVSSAILGSNDRAGAQKIFWENFLKGQMANKQAFKIQSGLDTIENAFFESISFERTQNIGDSLVFDCTIKEIVFVGQDIKITASPYGKSHKTASRGQINSNIVLSGFSEFSEAIGAEEQTFPKVPFGSITKIEDRIRTPLAKAKNKVLSVVNGAESKISSFVGGIVGRIF